MLTVLKRNFQNQTLIRSAVYIILGIAIFINPQGFLNFVSYFIIGYLVIMGFVNVLDDYKAKSENGHWGLGLFSAIFLFILALVVLMFSPTIMNILPLILGLAILFNACFQVVLGINEKSTVWLVYSGVLFAAGAVVLFNPFSVMTGLLQFFAAVILLMGVCEGIGYFMFKNTEEPPVE